MAVPPQTHDFAQLRRNASYYLPGGDLHFLAGNELFRIHRYFFERESDFWRARLATPASPGAARLGTSDSNALLVDVPAVDFERFLWIFYNPTYSPYDAPIRDWGRVLDLAHKWSFQEVKHLALRELEKLTIPIIARICLYEKYEVDLNLLVPLYAKLCSRDTILTLQETEALGLKTSHIIFLGRERLRAQTPDRSPLPPGADEESVKVTIEILLGIRLEEDQSGGTANITGNTRATQGASGRGHAPGGGTGTTTTGSGPPRNA